MAYIQSCTVCNPEREYRPTTLDYRLILFYTEKWAAIDARQNTAKIKSLYRNIEGAYSLSVPCRG